MAVAGLAIALLAVALVVGGIRPPVAADADGGGQASRTAGRTEEMARTAEGVALLPLPAGASLRDLVGQEVAARGVQVQAVSADEGFRVGSSGRDRVWVQLLAARESTLQVRTGQRLDFQGRAVANPARFPSSVGVDEAEGARVLEEQGAHLQVDPASLRLAP